MNSKSVLVLVSPASQVRLEGIVRYASERGWTLALESEPSNPPLGWRGDGVIATVKDTPRFKAFLRRLRAQDIPVVNVSGQCADTGLPTVCGDDARIGALAAEHFAERRFRHVAWFSSKWGKVQKMRFTSFSEGWKRRMPAENAPIRMVWSENAPLTKLHDWRAFLKWLGGKLKVAPRPLGIFAYSDYDAARVESVCREQGIAVPEEVSVLGVDNSPMICLNQPIKISSVNHDLARIGYEGAALLERLMDGRRSPARPILVPPRGITVRRSTDTVAVDDPTLRAAMLFIAENLSDPIGAPQVADGIGISRLQLDRLFAKKIGMSVGREIARQRLVKAKLLLGGTTMTLAEVAREVGYCDAAYLANVFRRETGTRPGKWRKASSDQVEA